MSILKKVSAKESRCHRSDNATGYYRKVDCCRKFRIQRSLYLKM
ncbi:unnamed protein product [Haemonchus placei]|uniref:Orphan protein n=1 Tax=Haemonchus placei TaxID=6290 RepID=A0A0N4W9J3_HAEPC|nr:unnamed protein product [Haemonchus placei]